MKTVQMTLDEDLVERVDRAARALRTSRSAFTRDALRQALAQIERRDAEQRQWRGYERLPVEPGEFDYWEDEQVWADGCSAVRYAGTGSPSPTRTAPF